MRLGFICSLAIAATALALPAAAQDAVTAPAVDLDAPAISDTKAGKVDWYRQFAISKPADARPVWQAEPVEDLSMQFSGSTRWEFNVDKLSRPSSGISPLPREEMQAGATFKITPRLSVGGEVSVGAEDLNKVTEWESRDVEAGIRLKSAFKF
ncbi:MAG: hypothetical protein KDA53_00370 [Hyphomonas sp.]|nr:hypothetical protein [Hyphomonas sp.]